ncbi:MAG: HAD family acid phosphatase [Ignavibacteriales bacterium]|nr:MAG: HAD family acid phosphatase [Ignavibacteriales bacterium]
MKLTSLFLFALISLLFFNNGCCPSIQNVEHVKRLVTQYYESGQYEAELKEILDDAKEDIDKIIPANLSAVIFDVDETALSNFKYMKQYDYGYEKNIWDEWIKKAEAEPIVPVRDLYSHLVKKGFRIIFLTGRRDYQYQPTYDNLLSAGYTTFDTLITRSQSEYKLPAGQYKTQVRASLVNKGYTIVANFGDQQNDVDGANSGIAVKLPNYQYGVE